MANMASQNRFMVDSELFIEPEGSSAHTTVGDNASNSYLSLDALGAYWDTEIGDYAMPQQVAIKINVTDLDLSDLDETYVFEVETDYVNTFDEGNTVIMEFAVTATGEYTIIVPRELVEETWPEYPDAAPKFLRLVVRAGGTTPSITYNAYASPVVGH